MWFMTMRGRRILVKAIEVQKENWGNHAFFIANYSQLTSPMTSIWENEVNTVFEFLFVRVMSDM